MVAPFLLSKQKEKFMSYKAYETIKYFEQYDGERIYIKSDKAQFDILFNKFAIPHLLGMQYMYESGIVNGRLVYIDENNRKMSGKKIYDSILVGMSDEEIFERIKKNNPSMLSSIKNRIETFTHFMKNLENGYIVENVKTDNLGGKVNYFVVQDDNGNYNHLGIKSENGIDIIDGYNENTSKLITYFKRKDNIYFDGSKIHEDITLIEVYDRDLESYIPFSFDKEKNERLRDNRPPKGQGLIR